MLVYISVYCKMESVCVGGKSMTIRKITKSMTVKVKGQGCNDDCTEHNKLVGKTNRNTPGCVYYDTIYTAKGNILW